MTAYASQRVTIGAGDSLTVNVTGTYLACLELTGATDITARLGSTPPQYFAEGLKIRARNGDRFSRVELINPNGSSVTARIAFGDGDLIDQRLTASGIIGVDDEVSGDSFGDVIGQLTTEIDKLIAALREDQQLRAPLVTLDGASYALVTNANTVIVPAGSNANGIIVRKAMASATAQGGNSSTSAIVKVDGNAICRAQAYRDTTNGYGMSSGMDEIVNYFIPPGLELAASTNDTAARGECWYEVL